MHSALHTDIQDPSYKRHRQVREWCHKQIKSCDMGEFATRWWNQWL